MILNIHTKMWGSVFTTGAYVSGVVVALVFVALYYFLGKLLKTSVSRTLIKAEYDAEELAKRFNNIFGKNLDIDALVNKSLKVFNNEFGVKNSLLLYASEKDKGHLEIFANGYMHRNIDTLRPGDEKLIKEILEIKKATLKEEFGDDLKRVEYRLEKYMEQIQAFVVVPIRTADELKAVLFLGEKISERRYTVNDIEFLEGLSPQFALALEKARLYREVQSFNIKLQEEVEKATKELIIKVEELQVERKREQEILDIMGHELRTPTSISKISLEFLLSEIKKGKLDKKEIIRQLNNALSGINRQFNLAQRFLTAAKLSNGVFAIYPQPTNLIKIVTQCVNQIMLEAKEKGLKIVVEKKKLPFINADPASIHQVISNLLDNAIKYTEKGGIKISFSIDKNFIWTHIKDTGRGIPKEEIGKLGKKFYRVKEFGRKPISGTGLGLYVVTGIVKAHCGKFKIRSQEGKGTTISFSLPI